MAKQPGTILIVDDDEDILISARLLLKRQFSKVVTSQLPENIPFLMAEENVDAVLLDMNFSIGRNTGEEGFYWLREILRLDPATVVILITAYGGVDLAVQAMKKGATDFVVKPWQNPKLIATMSAAVSLSQSRREATALKEQNQALAEVARRTTSPMIGASEPLQKVMDWVRRAAPTDASVLILGENGTGKDLVAREIHAQSTRADSVFVPVDLGALPESLFESELFGHKKGAFTGARENRQGRILSAHQGTLFLDEIGNVSLPLQGKLLTALEQRQVTPVGSDRAVSFDARIVSATNVPRAELEDEKRFRPDLLYRLNTVEVELPPLRERVEDVPLLVAHFLALCERKYGRPHRPPTAEAMKALESNAWPGNIRSLRHAVERAVIMGEGEFLGVADFSLAVSDSTLGAKKDISQSPENLNLEELERQAVETALRRFQGNVSRAAKALGLTRAALYRRMDKHGL